MKHLALAIFAAFAIGLLALCQHRDSLPLVEAAVTVDNEAESNHLFVPCPLTRETFP